MKKHYFRSAVAALASPFVDCSTCWGLYRVHHREELTADGSTLVGRTEDLEPNHNKKFCGQRACLQ